MPQNFLQSQTVLGGSRCLIASHLSFIGVIDGLPLYMRNFSPMYTSSV